MDIANSAWNFAGVASYSALPFDLDGDSTTFSRAEQIAISRIWNRVSEDYSPFRIDVTTEPPARYTPRTARVVITRNIDARGVRLPASNSGGVSYVSVFGGSRFAT